MHRALPLAAFLIAVALGGCHSTSQHHAQSRAFAGVNRAIVVLSPTEGNNVRGTIRFVQKGGAVEVTADVSGLTPDGTHAWHVHEFGDISDAQTGNATGGHYNPEGHDHGLPSQTHRHAGDLGNLEADSSGRARKTLTVRNISVAGARNPVVGRAIIIHAMPDDGGQPTGNAGARIAQGVIGIAKSE